MVVNVSVFVCIGQNADRVRYDHFDIFFKKL